MGKFDYYICSVWLVVQRSSVAVSPAVAIIAGKWQRV